MACKGGCTCHNSTDYQPCTPEPTCYNGCTSSPCAYAVLSKCQFGIGVDAQGRAFDENVFTRHITTLWRHCLYDENNAQNGIGAVKGTWSARKNCGGLNPLGPFRGGKVDNSECVAVGQAYDVVPHNPKCDGNYIGDMIFGCDTTNQTSCTGCTWSAFELSTSIPVWELTVGGPAPGGGGPGPPSTPVTASLNVYVADCAIPGTVCLVASYSNDAFSCLGRTTFTKAGSGCFPNYQDIYNKLPQQVCLVPYASNWIHPCGTDNSEICDCRDDGCSSFPLDLTLICNETVNFGTDWTFFRHGGFGATGVCLSDVGPDHVDVCSCITFPDTACGFFAGSLTASGTTYLQCGVGADVHILLPIVWCDGGEWTIQTWCITYTPISGGYTNLTCAMIDEQQLQRTNDCALSFYPITVDASASTCCVLCPCPNCGTLPGTLHYDLSGPGSCSGTVATGGGAFCFTCNASNGDHISIKYDPSDCSVKVNCNAGTDCVTFNCLVFPTVTTNDCDPYDVTITFTGGGFLCGACGAGTWTVHIYE